MKKRLGELLGALRILAGISWADFSSRTGLSDDYLKDLVRGKRKNPSLRVLNNLAGGLGRSLVLRFENESDSYEIRF